MDKPVTLLDQVLETLRAHQSSAREIGVVRDDLPRLIAALDRVLGKKVT